MSELQRLRFALESLDEEHWADLERFVSAYLSDEFPGFRSLGGAGDSGRDGALFECNFDGVIFQTSVAEKWRDKVRATLKRLRERKIHVSQLVYCTSRRIGPRGDELRAELSAEGVALDMRDQSYWVDRIERSDATRVAAREIADRIVDPLLPATEIIRNSALSAPEMRAGLLYIELQLHDADVDRGLTKQAYDAIVLSALAGTDAEKRMSRAAVIGRVQSQFPEHDQTRVSELVSAALERLRKQKRATIDTKSDTFALHYAQRVAIAEKAAEIAMQRGAFRNDLELLTKEACVDLDIAAPLADSEILLDTIEAAFEDLLSRQGNEFASGVVSGSLGVRRVDVFDVARTLVSERAKLLRSLAKHADLVLSDITEVVTASVSHALARPPESMQTYVRGLSDAYTLLAFLQETPDVQSAVSKLFSEGRLVLDATVLLPLFPETLIPAEQRRFTNLLLAAREAGMRLEVTGGVLNEIEGHLQLALRCFRYQAEWRARVPLVLALWQELGGSGSFSDFVAQFAGERPIDDLADFLRSEVGVQRTDLLGARTVLDEHKRWEFAEIWREEKQARRPDSIPERIELLVRHDLDMYLGVLGLRHAEKVDAVGYRAWWVTSDSLGFQIADIARPHGISFGSNPCMHPNFLSNLLTIGPARTRLQPSLRRLLPIALNAQIQGSPLDDLSDLAADIRRMYEGKPEYFVRRKMREAMARLKADRREYARAGAEPDMQLSAPVAVVVPSERMGDASPTRSRV